MKKRYEEMSPEELREELDNQREYLEDFEETHTYHLGKSSAHIGASLFASIQDEYEEERRVYLDRIARLEALIDVKGSATPSQ